MFTCTFARVAALEKGSLPMIGKLAGHTNSMTTARYAHLTKDPVDRLAEDVASRISKALGGDTARKRRRHQ